MDEDGYAADYPLVIQAAAQELGASPGCIARALVIFHNFAKLTPDPDCCKWGILAASINLSLKTCGESSDLKQLIPIMHRTYMQHLHPLNVVELTPKEVEIAIKDVIQMEWIISRALSFSLEYEVAHQTATFALVKLKKDSSITESWDVFNTFVWQHICTFYLSKMCIEFTGAEIAYSCILIGAKRFCVDLANVDGWKEELAAVMDKERLSVVMFNILRNNWKILKKI